MKYRCKKLTNSAEPIVIYENMPLILDINTRTFNAELVDIQVITNVFSNDDPECIWIINEPGPEPLLYEGLEFNILVDNMILEFKVL